MKKTQRVFCVPVTLLALFTVAKRQKQPKCPSTEGQTNHRRYIHTTEYDVASTRNEILAHGTARRSLAHGVYMCADTRTHGGILLR